MAAQDVEAYAPFQAIGAVLKVIRFPYGTPTQELLIDAMRHLARRYDAQLVSFNGGEVPDGVFRIQLREDRCPPVPMPISFQDLWGDGYDVEADRVQVYHYVGSGCSWTTSGGLARALLTPPYGLRKGFEHLRSSPDFPERERAWMRDCVHRFCAEVLGVDDLRNTSYLKIHEWSIDWSNFFDAGQEWWGSFCWTIEDPKRDWTTAILASSTD